MWLSDFIIAIMIICVLAALEFGLVQYCQVMEKRRAAKLKGLHSASKIAERLIQEAKEESVTLLKLLQRYEAKEVTLSRAEAEIEQARRHEVVGNRRGTMLFAVPVARNSGRAGSKQKANPDQVMDDISQSVEEMLDGEQIIASASGKHCRRLARPVLASENSVREADLIFIKFVQEVFERYDPAVQNRFGVQQFQASLTYFNIYVSTLQAAGIMAMFLRDSGHTTGLDEMFECLRFSEYTQLLLQIDSYALACTSGVDRWWNLYAMLQKRPPSERVDYVARRVFALLIFCLDVAFFSLMGNYSH